MQAVFSNIRQNVGMCRERSERETIYSGNDWKSREQAWLRKQHLLGALKESRWFLFWFLSAILYHYFEKTFRENHPLKLLCFSYAVATDAIVLKNKHCLRISSKVMRLLYLYLPKDQNSFKEK